MGSHVTTHRGKEGTFFAVWAPNAKEVSVIGNFNHWQKGHNKLHARWDESGIWEGFFPGVGKGKHTSISSFRIQANSSRRQIRLRSTPKFLRRQLRSFGIPFTSGTTRIGNHRNAIAPPPQNLIRFTKFTSAVGEGRLKKITVRSPIPKCAPSLSVM